MMFLRQNWVCKRNFGGRKPFLVALFLRSTFSHKNVGAGGGGGGGHLLKSLSE